MKRVITSLILTFCITVSWAQNEVPVFNSMPKYSGNSFYSEGYTIERFADKTYVHLISTCSSDDEYFKIGGKENRTFLEDVETGDHYLLRGMVTDGIPLGGEGFMVKGMKGKKFAVTLEFPPLPKEVRKIRFWHLTNRFKEGITHHVFDVEEYASKINYDQALPQVPKLTVYQDASKYDKEDKYTFPIFGDECAVVSPEKTNSIANYDQIDRTAIWCTKECTVVAHLGQLSWDMHYFQQPSKSFIRDLKTGKQYFIQSSYNTPLDVSYNIKGVSGEWICSFDVYPPLPEECTVISISEPKVTDDVKNGASWGSGLNISLVAVARLQANQGIVKFKRTKIIE